MGFPIRTFPIENTLLKQHQQEQKLFITQINVYMFRKLIYTWSLIYGERAIGGRQNS